MPPAYRHILDSLATLFLEPKAALFLEPKAALFLEPNSVGGESEPNGMIGSAPLPAAIRQALDHLTTLQTGGPLLGDTASDVSQDSKENAAAKADLSLDGMPTSRVIAELASYFAGTMNWGHVECQSQLTPPPTIASIVATLLAAAANPNLCSEESSGRLLEAETQATALTAQLVGYDVEQSAGVFTFGGTGAMLYAAKIGLEKAAPGSHTSGLREPAVVLTSAAGHYCAANVASWLGLGEENVVRVATGDDNAIDIAQLERELRTAVAGGKKIAAIVATLGTTDGFGCDDLAAIHELRERLTEELSLDYRPHIHADAAIGWAWSVFRDYDFERNELEFPEKTAQALRHTSELVAHLELADSIAVDFHKTGYAPYASSLVLFRNQDDLELVARSRASMPYLYQAGHHHPGTFTLETSRSAAGPLAALANLLLLGKQGLRVLLGHAVDMSVSLREELSREPAILVLNDENVGPVTSFRAYPNEIDPTTLGESEFTGASCRDELLKVNDYNRRLSEHLRGEAAAGRAVAISLTECYRTTQYGEPIVALKSTVLSPFATVDAMRKLVDDVRQAQTALDDLTNGAAANDQAGTASAAPTRSS